MDEKKKMLFKKALDKNNGAFLKKKILNKGGSSSSDVNLRKSRNFEANKNLEVLKVKEIFLKKNRK